MSDRVQPRQAIRLTSDERRSLARIRRDITDRGWAAAEGCVIVDDAHVATDYTIGLTRQHGHPEIIVVGQSQAEGRRLLGCLAREIGRGTRLDACLLDIEGSRFALVPVDDPSHLWLAHLLYARRGGVPVEALQLVAEGHDGLLPWESGHGIDLLLGDWPFGPRP